MQSTELLKRRQRVLGCNSPLFYDEPLHIVRGEGVWLYDAQGRAYLDVYNNVPHVGHCHPKVVEALCGQARTLNTHTRYLHENVVRYAERLTATFDDPLSMAMFACTGSEANELALRMARFNTGHQGIIVTDYAYHGNTAAVAELGSAFMPEFAHSKRVKAIGRPDTYVGLPGIAPEQWGDVYLAQIDAAIHALQQQGDGVAALVLCPAFANEGLIQPPAGYLEAAVARVRDAGGLFIADEVQAGFGRGGQTWWAYQRFGLVPDMVTLGKPMGNGHPISAVIASPELVEPFSAHSMYFNTFAGNPVSCAVANAVLDVLEEEALLNNAIETGAYIAEGLRTLQGRYEVIGDVRDFGLFFALELVTDRLHKTPATAAAGRVVNGMRDRGVLISKIGPGDNILKLRPPMPFTRDHADQLLTTLDASLAALAG
jgi:4-aminobutyrate aminotransferase-like enzyme